MLGLLLVLLFELLRPLIAGFLLRQLLVFLVLLLLQFLPFLVLLRGKLILLLLVFLVQLGIAGVRRSGPLGVINAVVDVLYAVLDPRVALGSRAQ